LAVIACASLAVGNLAALVQRNVKRMLAYSSISYAVFCLNTIAAGNSLGGRALLFYLIPYGAMSVAAFAVVAARERELGAAVTVANMAGLWWERPFFGLALWVCMLGFAGLPLTGGFVGKFYAFSAAYDRGWIWLVIVGLVATAVSLYYYFGLLRAGYIGSPAGNGVGPGGGRPPPGAGPRAAARAGTADGGLRLSRRDRRKLLLRRAADQDLPDGRRLARLPVLRQRCEPRLGPWPTG